MAVAIIIHNLRGGWSLLLPNRGEIGNYASQQAAADIALLNGYTPSIQMEGGR
jgi:hypothetical protein